MYLLMTFSDRICREYLPPEIYGTPFRQQQPLCHRIQEVRHDLLPTKELHFALQNSELGIMLAKLF